MAEIRKKSSIMIIIVIILLVLLSSGGVYTVYLTNTVKPDAEVINSLGTVRGSIQRLIKLELNSVEKDELIKSIDSIINKFKSDKIIMDDKNHKLKDSLNELEFQWKKLKSIIYQYRLSPSEENKITILNLSEEIWDKADNAVLLSQLISERKIKRYRVSFIFFIINLFLGIATIYLIKKYVKDTLEHLVNYDGLTNIYNRRYFNNTLKHEITSCEKHNNSLSLIMIDIDNFKRVNDNYGHDTGDYVLKQMCAIIKANLRRSDVFARLGGEEFVIVTPRTNIKDAKFIAEKVRKVVEEYKFQYVENITISLGVTEFIKGDNSDNIYKRSDIALYKAKTSGKNRVELELKEEAYTKTP